MATKKRASRLSEDIPVMSEPGPVGSVNLELDTNAIVPAADTPDPFAGLVPGRIVHFIETEKDEVSAAVVTRVWDRSEGLVNLHVWGHSGINRDYNSVRYDANGMPRSWHWSHRTKE